MTIAPNAAAGLRFAETLQAEHGGLQAFIGVLRDEQDALTEGNVDALPALAEEKLAVADRVTALAQARRQCVCALGLTADRAGIDAWLQRFASPEEARMWHDIVSLAETGRALNETNGVLIQARLNDSRQALTVLRNAAAAGGLYGRDGHARPQGNARAFGAA